MIRIRHSAKPYQELEIEGSNAEFSDLRLAILRFCDSAEAAIQLAAQSEFDPAPYQYRLKHLRLCRTEDPLLISVADGKLFISGKPEFLRLFAANLPYDARHNSTVPYHVHFDRIGREERVSEASLDIILTLKR
jgi:hypothetical protein